MTQNMLEKHRDIINEVIANKSVTYTTSGGESNKIIVHCYYIESKKVGLSVYAVKNKKTHAVSRYVLKLNIDGAQTEYTGDAAQSIYNALCAKHELQIAKTQLKKNFHNRAFVRKR